VKRLSERARAITQLAVAIFLVGAFVVPGIQLPFGSSVSLLDLLYGTHSGGTWQPARVALVAAFVGALVFLGASARRVLKARHASVA
jgi:hypothetical protein